jgi:hypothetical protein
LLVAVVGTPAGSITAIAEAINQFTQGVKGLKSVRRVWVPESRSVIQYWILLDEGRPEWIDEVLDLERELLTALQDAAPIEVLVYGADEVDESLLPSGKTVYERLAA